MIYITGESDSIQDVRNVDPLGQFDDEKCLLKLNPHLNSIDSTFPPFTPIILVEEDLSHELTLFDSEDWKLLHLRQKKRNFDSFSLAAVYEVVRELKEYRVKSKKHSILRKVTVSIALVLAFIGIIGWLVVKVLNLSQFLF